jgi:hypothetical protein
MKRANHATASPKDHLRTDNPHPSGHAQGQQARWRSSAWFGRTTGLLAVATVPPYYPPDP